MKNRIYLLLAVLFTFGSITAQVDRSQQPNPGPAPKITLDQPVEFELENGLQVLLVENHKLPRVSMNLAFDRTPIIEGEKCGVTSLLGAMLGNGTTTISKDEYNEEIDFLGANISFGFNGGFASSLTKYNERIIELLADATMNSLLTEEEFIKEKDRLLENLKSQEKSIDAIAGIAGGALTYGTHHPYGEFESESSINKVNFEDIQSYYTNYFNPSQAYLVVLGDINPDEMKVLVEKNFGAWKKNEVISQEVPEATSNPSQLEINFVDMPNAVQSNISLTSHVKLEMSDPDYHAVLIANKILGGGFNSYLNMNLREEHGYTYGARSSVGSDQYITRFRAGSSVRNEVTDSAVVQMLKEVKRIQDTLVDEAALKNAKAKYVGDFVLALEQPSTIARYAINVKTNNLPADFYSTYLEKINAVTTADVQRVANKYFNGSNARFIVVGKGSDVIGNLEKTGIPIKYFDREANPVDKPQFLKPIPEGMTASKIFENYVEAIGGSKTLNGVKTIKTTVELTIPGAPFKPTGVMKSMAPNKESMEISAAGMGVIMKQVFNGKSGYSEQQGMKTEMSDEEIEKKKAEKGLFPEMYLNSENISLISLSPLNGADVYKIQISENSFRYYDSESFLLVRTEEMREAQGQKMTQTTDLSEYKSIDGIMMPHTSTLTIGPQVITYAASEIKINDGVSKKDFK
jgi:predicted Zn-dependent peptidase